MQKADQGGIAGGTAIAFVSDGVAVVGTVGGVTVDDDGRVPLVEEADQGADLGALQLDEVAVEVESLGIGPDAHAVDGAVLLRTMGFVQAFIAVGVEDGGEDEDEVFQQRSILGRGQIAGQHEERFLAIHLAGMNVSLGIDDELAGAMGFLRGGHRRIGKNEQRQSTAFLAGPQLSETHHRRFLRQLLAEGGDVGVPRSGLIVGLLGNSQWRLGPSRDGEDHQGEKE